MNNNPIENKIVWLIGASAGIGRELTKEILRSNPKKLIISARNDQGLNELKTELNNDSRISVAKLDSSKKEQIVNVHNQITKDFGDVDTLIYNAGVYHISTIENFSSLEQVEQIEVNYLGAIYSTETVLKQMISKKSGNIVVVSSVAGYSPLPQAYGYGASKAALTYFFESMRFNAEKYGINITMVHPGFVETRLTAKNKFKMPWIMSPKKAAKIITDGILINKKDIAFPLIFVLILKFISILPASIHRILLKGAAK